MAVLEHPLVNHSSQESCSHPTLSRRQHALQVTTSAPRQDEQNSRIRAEELTVPGTSPLFNTAAAVLSLHSLLQ